MVSLVTEDNDISIIKYATVVSLFITWTEKQFVLI